MVTKPPIEVLVIVDPEGHPISTTTVGVPPQTAAPDANPDPPAYQAAPTPSPSPSSSAVYQPPPPSPSSSSSQSEQPTSSAVYQAPSPSASPDSQSSSGSSSSGSPASGHGISYTPYRADGQCKSKDEVAEDIKKLDGYSMIRIYGTDCDQLAKVLPAAKDKNLKIFAGISNDNVLANKVQDDVEAFATNFGSSWDMIDTISVGNELVNSGHDSGLAVSAVNAARTALRSKGYNGPVVSVDTFVAIKNHPEICQNSDYAAANIHPFFDGNVAASDSGKFITDQAKTVADACPGKKVIVTETGWPTQGGSHQKAIPSPENQQAALGSITDAFSSNPGGVVFFTAYNELWKKDNDGTFGCEKYWGIHG